MSESAVDLKTTLVPRDFAGAQAEWSAQYVQFAMRSAGRTASILGLSGQILERVAQGQLSPAALQESLPGFVQTRGREYANEVSALTARFFTGLLQASTGCSDDVAPPFDPTDPIRWFQRLADYSAQLNAEMVGAHQSQLHRAAAGDSVPGAPSVEQRLPEHLTRISRLYFDVLNDLIALRTSYEEEYLRRVLATADGLVDGGSTGLHLVAPTGEVASASVTLENTRNEHVAIRCAVTDVRRADGVGPGFASHIAIIPDIVALEPGEEARVELSVRLDPVSYEPDAPYVGALQVTRHGDSSRDVPIRIIATSTAGAESRRGPR